MCSEPRRGAGRLLRQHAEHAPRREKDEPKEAVLEELEAVAEGLVCDGEQRKQRHGRRHGTEEPRVGAVRGLTHHVHGGDDVEHEAQGLEPRDPSQGHGREERVLQAQRGEEFDEEGEEVLAHPKRVDVGDDLVDDTEAPEQGPKSDDGQAEEAWGIHEATSSVAM